MVRFNPPSSAERGPLVMQLRPHRHDRRRALVVLASLLSACTRLVGEVPSEAGADAFDAAAVCPTATAGHAPGEPDPTLQGHINDDRLALFHLKGAQQDALGRVYAYGALFGCSGPSDVTDVAVVRLTENGALDGTFGDRGLACTGRASGDTVQNSAFALTIDHRGRVVVAGLYYVDLATVTPSTLVARFDADGRPDEGFGPHGFRRLPLGLDSGSPHSCALAVYADADGIVLAGAESDPFNPSSYGFLTRLRGDGAIDTSFRRGEVWFDGSSWSFSALARTPRGQYLAAGASRVELRPRVVMFGSDGEPVTSFGVGSVATHTRRDLLVRGFVPDARGGFVLGGGLRGTQSAGLVRFDANGLEDRDFGAGESMTTLPLAWNPGYGLSPVLARQCDGRMLLVSGDGGPGFTLARVDGNGVRDTTFGGGLVAFGPVQGTAGFHEYAALVHPRDGRITVVTTWNDNRGLALWRFWP